MIMYSEIFTNDDNRLPISVTFILTLPPLRSAFTIEEIFFVTFPLPSGKIQKNSFAEISFIDSKPFSVK